MTQPNDTVAALSAEGDDLDKLIINLAPGQWATSTPAIGWTVAHQVAHLAATFRLAGMAASDPEWFSTVAASMGPDLEANISTAMGPYLSGPPGSLLGRWREERAATQRALAALPGSQLVPWLVRPIPAAMLAAAGMMEMFAHGQDIADALGVTRTRTDRIRFIVGFIAATWDFGYQARNLTVPATPPRFDLTSPSGERWLVGPVESVDVVSGSALDLCLLATRRRHRADLGLTATGPNADQWLDIAQCYRGSPGPGRAPGQFRAAV